MFTEIISKCQQTKFRKLFLTLFGHFGKKVSKIYLSFQEKIFLKFFWLALANYNIIFFVVCSLQTLCFYYKIQNCANFWNFSGKKIWKQQISVLMDQKIWKYKFRREIDLYSHHNNEGKLMQKIFISDLFNQKIYIYSLAIAKNTSNYVLFRIFNIW